MYSLWHIFSQVTLDVLGRVKPVSSCRLIHSMALRSTTQVQKIVFQTPIVVQWSPINKERRQFCCHWCWGDTGSGLIRQCSFEAIITFIASGECPRPFGVIGLGEFVAERERMYLLKPYCVYVAPGTCGKNQFPTGVQFSLSPG